MNVSGSQCPFCGKSSLRRFSAQASDTSVPSRARVNLTECTECVTAWQWPLQRTTEESISEFDAAYAKQVKDSYFDPAKRAAIGELQRELIAANIAGSGTLLDVGCGDACFAKIMADNGWQVIALDPALPPSTADSSECATPQFVRGSFSDLPEGVRYDVITLWDVVEHVEDPLGLITEAANRLAPGGLLVIETGNYQSGGRITGGENWWAYQLDHRWYLAPPQLSQLMTSAGLGELRLTDRVLRPWWNGQKDLPHPKLFTLIKTIIKNPLGCWGALRRYRQLVEGHKSWREWGGLEIMTMIGHGPKL